MAALAAASAPAGVGCGASRQKRRAAVKILMARTPREKIVAGNLLTRRGQQGTGRGNGARPSRSSSATRSDPSDGRADDRDDGHRSHEAIRLQKRREGTASGSSPLPLMPWPRSERCTAAGMDGTVEADRGRVLFAIVERGGRPGRSRRWAAATVRGPGSRAQRASAERRGVWPRSPSLFIEF